MRRINLNIGKNKNMNVELTSNAVAPTIDWSTPSALRYTREESGVIIFINETTMSTETTFLALCILNTSTSDVFIPGRLYPGMPKDMVEPYDGRVTLSN